MKPHPLLRFIYLPGHRGLSRYLQLATLICCLDVPNTVSSNSLPTSQRTSFWVCSVFSFCYKLSGIGTCQDSLSPTFKQWEMGPCTSKTPPDVKSTLERGAARLHHPPSSHALSIASDCGSANHKEPPYLAIDNQSAHKNLYVCVSPRMSTLS